MESDDTSPDKSKGSLPSNQLYSERYSDDVNNSAQVIKRKNQLQLSNLRGGEARWSVEENSLIVDDNPSSVFSQNHFSAENGRTFQQVNDTSSSRPDYLCSHSLDSSHYLPNISDNNLTMLRDLTPNNNSDRIKSKVKINNNGHSCKMNAFKDSLCHDGNNMSLEPSHLKDNGIVCSKPLTTITTTTNSGGTTRELREFTNDQINMLNGDDYEDEDGCIYTYKEGSGFEDKLLDHLLTTCISCGLPNLNFNVNDSLDEPADAEGVDQDIVYSPDMDFLEMDFDPGSTADDVDSDCEDNCSPQAKSNKVTRQFKVPEGACSIDTKLVGQKANNLSPKRKTLMLCKQCEEYPNINSTLKTRPKPIDNFSLENNNFNVIDQNALLDNRLQCIDEKSGAISKKIDNDRKTFVNDRMNKSVIIPLELNVKPTYKSNISHNESNELNVLPESSSNSYKKSKISSKQIPVMNGILASPTVNNDFNCFCKKGDRNCEVCDCRNNFKSSPKKKVADITIFYSSKSKMVNGSANLAKCSNAQSEAFQSKNGEASVSKENNLGSLSAPEVSPAHENHRTDSPLNDKFKRSVSFHNQLTSCSDFNVDSVPSDVHCVNKATPLYLRTHRHSHPSNVICVTPNLLLSNLFTGEKVKTQDKAASASSTRNVLIKKNYQSSDSSSVNVNSTNEKDGDEKTKGTVTGLVNQQVMVWSDRQALARQFTLSEKSSCGLIAVANVLLALDQHVTPSSLSNYIKINKRAEDADLVEYLLSRSCAGTTHQQLIDGIITATKGSISAKFFPMFPKRVVQLSRWISEWISKGAVCMLTLNLQKAVLSTDPIPDAWHHQMVYGVSGRGIHLTNPIECVSEAVLKKQLCSERVLLVKRGDVVKHHSPLNSLRALTTMSDVRWRDMNVLGQVSLVLKEELSSVPRSSRQHTTSHVSIPAAYESGVTVFMRTDNENIKVLMEAQQLPIFK